MKLAMLAAIAAALAPLAHAQDDCAAIKAVVGAAASAFASLRGERIIENAYASTVWLGEEAGACGIETYGPSRFYCQWPFYTGEDVIATYESLAKTAMACLAGWTTEDTSGGASPSDIDVLDGGRFTNPAYPGVTVDVFIVDEPDEDSTRVMFEVFGS